MSDNGKAPGWSVRRLDFRAGPRWCVYDEHRLVCWAEIEADATRIVEAVNGLAEAREDAAEVQVWRDHAGAIDDALGGYSLTLSRVQAVQAVVRERDDLRARLNSALASREGIERDRDRLVGECRRYRAERNDLRAELAALRGAANTVWRVDSVTAPDGTKLWSVYDGDRLVMAAEDEAQARLVAAAPGCLRVAKGARPELATLREHAAVEHHGDPVPRIESIPAATPASTLTALTQAAERLTATIERHEELLGIAAPKPDEIAKLRTVDAASWNVQIDGNNQCFRPCSEGKARETYAYWRTKLAADYATECAYAAEESDPKPEPPTLALVVEVVVDRWEP